MSANVIIPLITFFLGIDTIIALECIRDQNYSAALLPTISGLLLMVGLLGFTTLHRGGG